MPQALAFSHQSEFSPTDLGSGLILWLRGDMGVTLGSTMFAQGASPPVLTLTGTLTQSLDIRVRCPTTGGARGTWKLDYSMDGGVNYTTGVLSAATVTLPYGITLNIATGDASTDNTWRSTVVTWADQSGTGNTVTQATATKQPLMTQVGAYTAQPALTFDATDDYLGKATWTPPTNSTVLVVVSGVNTTSNGGVFAMGDVTTPANQIYWNTNWNMGGFTNGNPQQALPSRPTRTQILSKTYTPTGPLITGYIDGTSIGTSAATTYTNANPLTVGAGWSGGAIWCQTKSIYELIFCNFVLTSTQLSALHKYAGARYGIRVP